MNFHIVFLVSCVTVRVVEVTLGQLLVGNFGVYALLLQQVEDLAGE